MNSEQNTYRATAFNTPSGGGSGTQMLGGRLRVEPGVIHFQCDSCTQQIPVGGIQIRAGGHDGTQIFLEHPSLPGWSFTTSEKGLLAEPSLAADPGVRQLVGEFERAARRSNWPATVALVVLGLMVAGVVWAFAQKDRWVTALAEKVPVSVEEKIGEQTFASIQASHRMVNDPKLEKQLKAVTSRLLQGIDRKEIQFRFHIAADTNINAFAMPGGYVVVNSGLLAAVKRPEELAGVLAHEIAHVTKRHGVRNIIQAAGLMVLVQSIFGNLSGLESVIVRGSQELLSQKYSRDFEREADAAGWEYLMAADIDPRGLIDFFKTLKSVQGVASTIEKTPLQFLSTHPATDERIASLEERWRNVPKDRTFRPIPDF